MTNLDRAQQSYDDMELEEYDEDEDMESDDEPVEWDEAAMDEAAFERSP